jgi:hypothetical protein
MISGRFSISRSPSDFKNPAYFLESQVIDRSHHVPLSTGTRPAKIDNMWKTRGIQRFRPDAMKQVLATYRDGRVVLDAPVDWPDGIRLQVIPTKDPQSSNRAKSSLRNLNPLDLGETLRPLDAGDDLLEEMLGASRD